MIHRLQAPYSRTTLDSDKVRVACDVERKKTASSAKMGKVCPGPLSWSLDPQSRKATGQHPADPTLLRSAGLHPALLFLLPVVSWQTRESRVRTGRVHHKTGKTGETTSIGTHLCLSRKDQNKSNANVPRENGASSRKGTWKLAPARRATKLAAAGLGKLQIPASVSSMPTQRPITAGRSIPLWLRTPTSSVSRVACYPLPRPSQDRLRVIGRSSDGRPIARQEC